MAKKFRALQSEKIILWFVVSGTENGQGEREVCKDQSQIHSATIVPSASLKIVSFAYERTPASGILTEGIAAREIIAEDMLSLDRDFYWAISHSLSSFAPVKF